MKKILPIAIKTLIIGLIAFLSMGANCITSGNVMVVEYLLPMHAQTGVTITPGDVDLSTNSDWNDHKEDINGIDDLGFACRITNNTAAAASGQLYVSANDKDYTTEGAIRNNAILVLDGIVVPAGGTRAIEWQESYDYLKNFDQVKEVIFGEQFHYYFIAAETPFNIDVTDIVLFMSINGKP
ncbi:MAG: hypothetical protein WBP29_01625 [Candidatus Zixiibacteriota bacterium]